MSFDDHLGFSHSLNEAVTELSLMYTASPTFRLKTNQDCLHTHSGVFVYTETMQISDWKQQAISLKTEICLSQEILVASWGRGTRLQPPEQGI